MELMAKIAFGVYTLIILCGGIMAVAAKSLVRAMLPFLPGKTGWKWLLLVPSIIAIWSVMTIAPGDYGQVVWLGQTLHFGRVDKLSLIFAQVFAIMIIVAGRRGFTSGLSAGHPRHRPNSGSTCVSSPKRLW